MYLFPYSFFSILGFFFGIALFFSDRDENDDDTGSKNDNDSNT